VTQTPTKLERRARALLRAYPAEYRRDRAEEIIGTLLEAAPPGRAFPAARDTWSLIAGGRHARAARNCLSAKDNLRLALILGLSIFVGGAINSFVTNGTDINGGPRWLTIAGVALIAAAALAPWLGSRTATTALAIPAGASVAYERLTLYPPNGTRGNNSTVVYVAMLLIALGALAALSGGSSRLPRSWAWLPYVLPAAIAAGVRRPSDMEVHYEYALLLLTVVVVCWLVTDARPAIGFCVAQLLSFLLVNLSLIADMGMDWFNLKIVLLQLAIIAPILLPAVWLLRRQTAPSPRRVPSRNA
jgi:hypothetical protein